MPDQSRVPSRSFRGSSSASAPAGTRAGSGSRTSTTTASSPSRRRATSAPKSCSTASRPVWLAPDGRLLINPRLDRAVFRREADGTLVRHGELTPWAQGHANDMVVAGNGQAYAGNFGFELCPEFDGTVKRANIGPTSLVRVDPDGTSHEAADNLGVPQWHGDHGRRGHARGHRSMGGCLTAFDRSPDGTLSGRRQWAALPQGVAPDGICLCADDTILVADALRSKLCGWPKAATSSNGSACERLGSFACMLGGEDRRTLL